MPNKNLGALISGYTNPDGRAWETVVFQAGKPVLDKELVLSSELGSGQAVLKRLMPSGWISDDFLSTSSATSAIFTATTVLNSIEIPACLAHVNGWLIQVQNTNLSTTANQIDLGAAPTGAGAMRTDLIVLEVWRRLISAATSTEGKSAAGRIWFNGNVKIPAAADTTLNLGDDIKDTNVSAETTKRVQIQYRLRVIKGVDLSTYPYGMGDPLVVATTVPATASAPDGAAYTGPNALYTNMSANGDPGLWRAGDGAPTNALGTVDGYMYAIPLCAVFRRNSTAFNRLTNVNGAASSPTASDRPDGFWNNIIASLDVLDLRLGVSSTGWALHEVLAKNLNFLLDNGLRQEVVNTAPDGGGNRGTTVLRTNEIGGTVSTAGPLIGQFDGIRRRFSDRATYETFVVSVPSGSWSNGKVVTIDPYNLSVYPYTTPINWPALAPADAQIIDVPEMHWAGSAAAKRYADAMPYVTAITGGLGTATKTSITITFGTIASVGLTTENLFVTLTVAYPRDCGLSHTPVASYGNSSFELVSGALSASAPISFASFGTRAIDAAHREVQIEYTTTNQTYVFGASPTLNDRSFRLPERASSIVSAIASPTSRTVLSFLDASGRVITLMDPLVGSENMVTVTYVAVRPIPAAANAKMAVYFRSAAPATIPKTVLGTSLMVAPKLVSEKLLAITAGSGSQGEGYPFSQGYVQTGGVFPGTVFAAEYNGESSMAASALISVSGFSAETGMLTLHTYVPMVANPEGLTFTRSVSDVDVEDRTYFPTVSTLDYVPNAYAQNLSSPGRHKNVLPILAELSQDSTFGFKGQLVLILLVRYARVDSINGVFFDPTNVNTTSASVVRIKGLLLNKRVS